MLGTMRLVWFVVVVFGFAGVMGCASPVASPTGPLVVVETRGGECDDGPCGQTITIDRDGRVHVAAKPPNDLGTVTPEVLDTLDALIAATDFGAIKSHPFTGECPTAYDGQETIYTFSAPGGVETIASCSVVVDPALPLFAAVDAVVSAAGRP